MYVASQKGLPLLPFLTMLNLLKASDHQLQVELFPLLINDFQHQISSLKIYISNSFRTIMKKFKCVYDILS